jgi:transcriptional adapter 2-alpha
MRLFERFHTPEEHQIFINDLLKAKRLRKEIAKLQMYRRIGIRTQPEAERYKIDKARLLFHKTAAAEKI